MIKVYRVTKRYSKRCNSLMTNNRMISSQLNCVFDVIASLDTTIRPEGLRRIRI